MQRKLASHLDSDETLTAAILVEPKGTYGAGMIALAALPRLAGRKLAEKADEANDDAGGMAARFPGESSVVAVSDRRVLVVASNGLTVEEPAMIMDRGEIAVADSKRKGLGRRLQLVFADGSGVTVDAQSMQPFDRFRQALQGV
ncbi:MAG: hypothetical protein GY708_27765 [Actinomycetia bacterium]|nr:hypothetical protein [Actinomycetes bacterium]